MDKVGRFRFLRYLSQSRADTGPALSTILRRLLFNPKQSMVDDIFIYTQIKEGIALQLPKRLSLIFAIQFTGKIHLIDGVALRWARSKVGTSWVKKS